MDASRSPTRSSDRTAELSWTMTSSLMRRFVLESKADGSFAISENAWNEPLVFGTEITLHLRDEAKEYLEEGYCGGLDGCYQLCMQKGVLAPAVRRCCWLHVNHV
ncbi:uncharacterized protein LOC124651292 [Lolium rigidum]|uniref:uncharacterized protein LOC124651292 n=1 Tax=Lolium rigidum TaxID=89674 RepID=UPI001F5CDB59|nr:uncharacterized protein LOC124651292 [Lolium rigidum]